MGFLDNLFKKEARKIISGVVDSVVDEVVDNIRDGRNGSAAVTSASDAGAASTSYSTSKTASAKADYFNEDFAESPEDIDRFVKSIVAEEWSGYELRENISATELGAEKRARDYTYGLYLNGVPKAMILVLPLSHQYKNVDTRLAHKACKERGVFCMNLLPHMPNTRSYIAAMLRNNVAR